MLVAVVFMMAILILSFSIALPRVRASIQRDREVETMQRGKQYIRAVQLYYKKFNSYPPNIDALVKTNNIRFLRKKYLDPTTGKDEWKPVLFGQNKTPQAMGFFGQPLAAANGAGIGPSGNNTGLPGTSSTLGSPTSSAGGGLFSNNPSTGSTAAAGTDANGNPTPSTGTTGTGSPSAGTGSAFGSPSNPTGNGQTFGGGGIIGFSPQSPKQSILVYKKKNHYNEWEFTYSPISDMGMGGFQQAPPQLLGGQAPGTGGLSPTPAPGPAPGPTPQQQ